MSTIDAVEAGLYLYGITAAQDGLGISTPGIEGGEVEAIVADGVAAIVTRVAHSRIRAQRANLAVHHKLLHELVEHQTVLPCAFGTVAANEAQLRSVLHSNRGELLRQLAMLRGKVEMSLGVYWNTSNIFEFFVANNRELQEMRDRIFRPGRNPLLDERLELGKRFESLLKQCREHHTQQVIDALQPCCCQVRAIDPGQEQMIMKLVCLIEKDQQGRFEEEIHATARKFDDRYSFKYSGPWAPFDFVDVSLDLSP